MLIPALRLHALVFQRREKGIIYRFRILFFQCWFLKQAHARSDTNKIREMVEEVNVKRSGYKENGEGRSCELLVRKKMKKWIVRLYILSSAVNGSDVNV